MVVHIKPLAILSSYQLDILSLTIERHTSDQIHQTIPFRYHRLVQQNSKFPTEIAQDFMVLGTTI